MFIVAVLSAGTAVAQTQKYTTKAIRQPTPVWTTSWYYQETMNQGAFGAAAWEKALEQDIASGRAKYIERFTEVVVKRWWGYEGDLCEITIKGVPGTWYSSHRYFGSLP